MDTHIEGYTDFMRNVCRKSMNTVESYSRDVIQYLTYLDEFGVTELANTTKTTVLTYLLSLQKKGRAASTLSRSLASIRSYYTYLIRSGEVRFDPTTSLMTPKVEKKLPRVLSNPEIDALLSQPDTNENKGMRDKAMLEVLYATGIRVSELIGLNLEDVNLELGYIYCSNNKLDRTVPMGAKAVAALKNYMENSRPHMIKNEGENALFVNRSGERISRQGFWKLIKQYQKSAGIEVEITPHSLRHSFAAHLVENGADLGSVQTMMGHCDISSTKIYACYLDEKIKSVYQKAHPRA